VSTIPFRKKIDMMKCDSQHRGSMRGRASGPVCRTTEWYERRGSTLIHMLHIAFSHTLSDRPYSGRVDDQKWMHKKGTALSCVRTPFIRIILLTIDVYVVLLLCDIFLCLCVCTRIIFEPGGVPTLGEYRTANISYYILKLIYEKMSA